MAVIRGFVIVSCWLVVFASTAPAMAAQQQHEAASATAAKPPSKTSIEIVEADLKRLSKELEVWVDLKRKWVVLVDEFPCGKAYWKCSLAREARKSTSRLFPSTVKRKWRMQRCWP